MNFIMSYIDALVVSQEKSTNGMTNDFDRHELAQQIMKEANYFALASHFLWTLWSINMAAKTAIQFGYMV